MSSIYSTLPVSGAYANPSLYSGIGYGSSLGTSTTLDPSLYGSTLAYGSALGTSTLDSSSLYGGTYGSLGSLGYGGGYGGYDSNSFLLQQQNAQLTEDLKKAKEDADKGFLGLPKVAGIDLGSGLLGFFLSKLLDGKSLFG